MTKTTHIQRMEAEIDALNVKLEALKTFIRENPVFGKLPDIDQRLLNGQCKAMCEYSDYLKFRIERGYSEVVR